MNKTSDTKIVSFVPQPAPLGSSNCEVCGASKCAGAFCRACACSLFDLGLSSSDESEGEFPRLVEDVLCEEMPVGNFPLTYDHYEICQLPSGAPWELGRGAMGVTYKAFDTNLHREVALKIIHPSIVGSDEAGQLLMREARSAAQLKHPNIARVYSLGQLMNGSYFYAMEYIEGETLQVYVEREGALHHETALDIVGQAAQALCAAHQRRFIHRDLKPANIMVSAGAGHSKASLSVQLIDFGLVKALPEEEAANTICTGYFAGTPHYASPEQLQGGVVDDRSDIYSLGKCLWFMLAGQAPLPASEGFVVFTSDLPVEVPVPVLTLLQSMVAEKAEERPQSAVALFEQVQHCLTQLGTQDDPISMAKSPSKASLLGRRSRQIGLSLLVVVLLLAASAFSIAYPRSAKTKPLPDNSSAAQTEARVHYARGDEFYDKHTKEDNQRAIEGYGKATSLSPNYADAYAGAAMAYFQEAARYGGAASDSDLAVADAQRAIVLDPTASRGFHALGALRAWQGRPWEALPQLKHALELNPKSLPVINQFSLLWSSVGQPGLALPWARYATQVDPANESGWIAAADACVDLGADEEAEECCRRCLQLNPGWMAAHCELMHIHILQGKFAKAREEFSVAASIPSGMQTPLILKGQIALFSGEYREAEDIYRKLLASNRTGSVGYYGGISYLSALGLLRCRAGDQVEGEALLAEASQMHVVGSNGPQAIYDLAAIRSIRGRKEEGLQLLRQAVASGWLDFRVTQLDPRFEALREQEGFQDLMGELSQRVTRLRQESERLCAKPISLADYPVRLPH